MIPMMRIPICSGASRHAVADRALGLFVDAAAGSRLGVRSLDL